MRKQHAGATLAALALGVTLGLTGCADSDPGSMAGMDHSSAPPQLSQPPAPGASSSEATTSPTSTSAKFTMADVTFVQMMVPHHKQAVTMSDTLLKKSGVDGDVTALAKEIKAAQQPEIDTMEGWLKAWGQSMDGGMGGMHGDDDGMASDDELKRFDQADGAAGQKMYLEMMTRHHEGAIRMARTEIKTGQYPDAVQLAKDIASTQQKEIDTMTKLLAKR